MTTIAIEAQISTEQLIHAVERLPPHDLAQFVEQIIALRARRAAPHLGRSETALLLQINQGLPAAAQQRFGELSNKRQVEVITTDELQELIQITDQIEQHDAERLAALIELARLRQMSLDDLMDALGIPPADYA